MATNNSILALNFYPLIGHWFINNICSAYCTSRVVKTTLVPLNVHVGMLMKIVSFTEARNSLKAVLDGVVNDADTTVITRRDSEDAVVMSLDYYNSLMETVHLLRSPQNAEHLNRSITQYRAGKTTARELIDE
ncbi:hypothetical protein PSFL107428_03385 [Pseudoalteromonas maricaloris]